MTIRQLLGFTKHMGPFEISVAWLALPQSIKDKVPDPLKTNLNNFAAVVASYKILLTAYTTATQLLNTVEQAQSVASLPPNPAVATAVVSQQTSKIAVSSASSSLTSTFNASIGSLLDQNIPGT